MMYKYSFEKIKSAASDVSIEKLCECINCYTKITDRYKYSHEIDQRDFYDAQCFIEKYLLNLIYNVNSIVRYSSCNFATDELRNSYRRKLNCNKYILTYQKLCSLQKTIDVSLIHFIEKDIMDEYTNIIKYMLILTKANSIDSYQKIMDSFKLYLINDSQSPKDLIPPEIYMKDDSSALSPNDYADIFGFDYHRATKKRTQTPKSQKNKEPVNTEEMMKNYLEKIRHKITNP